MELKSQKVLVIGGAGLIGSHIVDQLVREGAEVRVFDSFIRGREENLAWAKDHGNLKIIKGDIRDKAAVRAAMKGCRLVNHQAACWLRACQDDPRLSLEVNIIGTFNILECCAELGIEKIVAASSSSVYGEGLYLPTDENHPFNNDLFYGASKVCNEQHYRCFAKKYGLDFIAFRYLNVYGPRQPFQAAYMDVVMHFLNRIEAGEPPLIDGDGSSTLDLVHVVDAARANILAMNSDLKNHFFNVCSGVETSVKELAEVLLRLKNRTDIKPIYRPRDSALVTRRWGDPAKARKMLDFRPEIGLEEGLMSVIAWRQEMNGLPPVNP